jgi:hypothetical protein
MGETNQPLEALGADAGPFVLEHYREQETGGNFVPAARLLIMPALRTSGLLSSLSDEAVRTLVALLTFLTSNGRIAPTVGEVAEALGLSESKARERIDRLCSVTFEAAPLAHRITHDSGLETVHLSRAVLAEREAAVGDRDSLDISAPIPNLERREAIIAYSRAAHARPRAEVEAEIAVFYGFHSEEAADTPAGQARRRLIAVGVPREEINLLIEQHPVQDILNQLDWLPMREARNPARFVVAAIQNRYEPPPRVRLERVLGADSTTDGAGTTAAAEERAIEIQGADEAGVDPIGTWEEKHLNMPTGTVGTSAAETLPMPDLTMKTEE